MRHKKRGRKFGLLKDQRKALLKGLSYAVVKYDSIITTEAKAKELRMFLEPAITKAKKGDLPSRRYLIKLFPPVIVKKLIEEVAPRYKERPGGYLRLIKIRSNRTDGASMVKVELL